MDEQEYSRMGFQNIGALKFNNDRFTLELKSQSKQKVPGVYLWLQRKHDGRSLEAMYAGKAGNGAAVRMNQHLGGLRLADPERIDRIKSTFGVGDCLEIWFRESEMMLIPDLYERKISFYSTEEEALITRFNPLLNRAKTPSMREVAKQCIPKPNINTTFDVLSKEINSTNGMQRDLWEDALSGLTESHKDTIGKIISSLDKVLALEDRWPTPNVKVVGFYTDGPLTHQTMLVFGEIAKINFKRGSKIVYISLENELIAFAPNITKNRKILKSPPDKGTAYSFKSFFDMLDNIR